MSHETTHFSHLTSLLESTKLHSYSRCDFIWQMGLYTNRIGANGIGYKSVNSCTKILWQFWLKNGHSEDRSRRFLGSELMSPLLEGKRQLQTLCSQKLSLPHWFTLGIQIKMATSPPFTHTSHPSVNFLWWGRGMTNIRPGVGGAVFFHLTPGFHGASSVQHPWRLPTHSLFYSMVSGMISMTSEDISLSFLLLCLPAKNSALILHPLRPAGKPMAF